MLYQKCTALSPLCPPPLVIESTWCKLCYKYSKRRRNKKTLTLQKLGTCYKTSMNKKNVHRNPQKFWKHTKCETVFKQLVSGQCLRYRLKEAMNPRRIRVEDLLLLSLLLSLMNYSWLDSQVLVEWLLWFWASELLSPTTSHVLQ